MTAETTVPLPRGIDTVLFDLDGTLTDPHVGITTSIRNAMRELGRPLPPDADLDWAIGPPLVDIFLKLFDGDRALAEAGVVAYRARYSVIGLFENEVYPGIPELLDGEIARGRRLYVATSKPRDFATRILGHFGLAERFVAIHGSEFDGTRSAKTDLLPWVLATEGIDPATAVMVGDRGYDVIGARAADLATIGVAWGFGGRAELEEAGAVRVVDRVADLAELLAARGGGTGR